MRFSILLRPDMSAQPKNFEIKHRFEYIRKWSFNSHSSHNTCFYDSHKAIQIPHISNEMKLNNKILKPQTRKKHLKTKIFIIHITK